MRPAFLAALWCLFAALGGCQSAEILLSGEDTDSKREATTPRPVSALEGQGIEEWRATVDGVERVTYVDPRGIEVREGPHPALVLIHGSTSGPMELAEISGMGEAVRRAGWVLVMPEIAIPGQGWNSHPAIFPEGVTPPSDVAYFHVVFERLRRQLGVDPNRTYVVGHVSGGMMAFRLAAEMPDRIRAIGVISGSAGIEIPGTDRQSQVPDPGEPVPLIAFHGTDNDRIPFWGGTAQRADRAYVSAIRSAMVWADYNELWPHPVKTLSPEGEVLVNRYPSKDGSTEVVLYRIPDGSAEWPDSVPPSGRSATELIMEFFRRFGK